MIPLLMLGGLSVHAQEVPFKVERAPFSSKAYKESAPVIYDSSIVFRADMRVEGAKSTKDITGNGAMNIFSLKDLGDGNWSDPELFANELYDRQEHHGPAVFNKEGDEIWYTRINEMTGKDKAKLGIYTGSWDGTKWTDQHVFEHCDPTYNYIHPYLSEDGKMLFFSSDRRGGEGQFDLYLCRLRGNTWSEPENLGANINTSRHEIYPVYYPNGRLYFSSRGHEPNLGDFDLYYSAIVGDEWQAPVHLNPPLNSKRLDAWFYALDTSFTRGYIHSDRQSRRIPKIYEFNLDIPEALYEECKIVEQNSYCFTFYEAGAAPLDTTQYRYEWVVEGEKFRQDEVDYCFGGVGQYQIALNVIDMLSGNVLFNQATYDLEIENIEQVYINSPDTIFVNDPVQFRGTETYIKDFTIDRYIWDMGDKNWVADTSVVHRYYNPGTYTIKLGVVKDADQPDQVQKTCGFKQVVVLPRRNGPGVQ